MLILYIVSTFKASGPTNQLYSLIKELPENCDINILTLSKEEKGTRIDEFRALGVNVLSLNLGRLSSIFLAKRKIKGFINDLKPSIVHTQGIRADVFVSKLRSKNFKWFATSHNFPLEDYVMKFGALKGKYMAKSHISALKKCKNLISCSKTVRNKLYSVGVESKAIQNGIDVSHFVGGIFNGNKKPIEDITFISVGSLISRKNTSYILNVFERAEIKSKLIILGDGVEMDSLREKFSSCDITFAGNVENVHEYLERANFFISASLSEGLPNTVLEALAVGKICYLSDIPSHREIYEKSNGSVTLFPLGDEGRSLETLISKSSNNLNENNYNDAIATVHMNFTAKIMSGSYFDSYRTCEDN